MADTLTAIIRSEMDAPIPFRRFMELALYHPLHGYYTSGRAHVGRKGDFFTNVSVGSLFGRLLAQQFAEMWRQLGQPENFTIVEQGANTGDFAADVLAEIKTLLPSCRYHIVEPSPVLCAKQRERLASFENVEWFTTQVELPRWTGVHFSNELIDAFPVHVVTWDGATWFEKHVTFSGDEFHFIDLPLSTAELSAACAQIPQLRAGTITEVNLAARAWVAETEQRMERGYILLVDYGWPRDEYHSPTRTTGTLSAYANHRREENPLACPGELDLTAHVNFSDLADAACAAGLQIAGFTDQHHFMIGLGEAHFADGANLTDIRSFQTLMHPQFMGLAFKVAAFSKNAPATFAGFRYARTLAIGS